MRKQTSKRRLKRNSLFAPLSIGSDNIIGTSISFYNSSKKCIVIGYDNRYGLTLARQTTLSDGTIIMTDGEANEPKY